MAQPQVRACNKSRSSVLRSLRARSRPMKNFILFGCPDGPPQFEVPRLYKKILPRYLPPSCAGQPQPARLIGGGGDLLKTPGLL